MSELGFWVKKEKPYAGAACIEGWGFGSRGAHESMRGPRSLIGGCVPHQEGHEHGALPLHIHSSSCLVWCWMLREVELSYSLLMCVGFRS